MSYESWSYELWQLWVMSWKLISFRPHQTSRSWPLTSIVDLGFNQGTPSIQTPSKNSHTFSDSLTVLPGLSRRYTSRRQKYSSGRSNDERSRFLTFTDTLGPRFTSDLMRSCGFADRNSKYFVRCASGIRLIKRFMNEQAFMICSVLFYKSFIQWLRELINLTYLWFMNV